MEYGFEKVWASWLLEVSCNSPGDLKMRHEYKACGWRKRGCDPCKDISKVEAAVFRYKEKGNRVENDSRCLTGCRVKGGTNN